MEMVGDTNLLRLIANPEGNVGSVGIAFVVLVDVDTGVVVGGDSCWGYTDT